MTPLGSFFFEKFVIYWFLRVWGTQRNFPAAQGPKRAKNARQWIFPVLGAVLGETPADQILLHAKCGPSEPCLGSWGRWGRNSSVGDRFRWLGTQLEKTFGPERNRKKEVNFIFRCGFKKCVFVENGVFFVIPPSFSALGAPLLGVRTEKT